MATPDHPRLGISGRIARTFQDNPLTPVLALLGLLLARLTRGPAQPEHFAHGAPNHILILKTRQFETSLPRVDHTRLLVTDEEGSVRGWIVIIQELKEKAEAAFGATLRPAGEPGRPITADFAVATVGADEEWHRG